MTRPTRVYIDPSALLHNVQQVRSRAPHSHIIAMVKANAYGCGLAAVIPVLEGRVNAFGVACLEEAITVRRLGGATDCILFQGVFAPEELLVAQQHRLQCVIHHRQQLAWLLATPLPLPMRIWVKVNTGMHRLGFHPTELDDVIRALKACPWVDSNLGLISHLANADVPEHPSNAEQLTAFSHLPLHEFTFCSLANSGAIIGMSDSHTDVVRPGIILYGVSPFPDKTGVELGLLPVMCFRSAISVVRAYPPNAPIGYGSTWKSESPALIGVIPAGYGDGYPRQINPNTPVWINGYFVPIVGRVSMDMLCVDLTHCPGIQTGDEVELWGNHVPIETVAQSAGTIPYELLCHISSRVRENTPQALCGDVC